MARPWIVACIALASLALAGCVDQGGEHQSTTDCPTGADTTYGGGNAANASDSTMETNDTDENSTVTAQCAARNDDAGDQITGGAGAHSASGN